MRRSLKENSHDGLIGELSSGDRGPAGHIETDRPRGPKGDRGLRGLRGDSDPKYEGGNHGKKGDPGVPGQRGSKGQRGEQGADDEVKAYYLNTGDQTLANADQSAFHVVQQDKNITKNNSDASFDKIEELQNELKNDDVPGITKSFKKDLPNASRSLGSSKRESLFKKELASSKGQDLKASMHQKSNYTKDKKVNDGIKFLKLASNKMFSFDQNDLEREEPESSGTNYQKYFKKLVLLCVVVYLVTAIAVKSFMKIGKEKIKNLNTEMKNELIFNLTDPDQILPFHWFMELNKQDVVDRMECLINKDSDRCFEMQEQTCRARFEVKGKNYQNCMMRAYKMYSKDKPQFCQDLYYESDTYFPAERSTQEFLYNYHECLLAAEVPKGKQYCDDIFGKDETLDRLDLYKCYDNYNVSKGLWIEDECLVETSLIIPKKTCIDDLLYADSYGDDCIDYSRNPGWCGGYDTEFFKSHEMCCACDGGTQDFPNLTQEERDKMIESQSKYTGCLTRNDFKNISDRFACDMLNATYDQYQFRAQCWDDENNWLDSDSYCQTTLALIKERLQCYQDALGDDENDKTPNSLGFCETYVLSQTDQKPSLQNFLDCYYGYVFSDFASIFPQKCGCEEDGKSFCYFEECSKGTCDSCENLESIDFCEYSQTEAGVNDCKLRCFNEFHISPWQIDDQCGRYDYQQTLKEIPENERQKFCSLFYPITSNNLSSKERNDCQQQIGIQFDRSYIYEQCSSLAQYGTLEDYKNCLVRLGTQPKADACLIGQGDYAYLDLDAGLLIYEYDRQYQDCLVSGFNQTLSAEFCFTNQFGYDGYLTDIINCLENFGLPITEEDKCLFDRITSPIYYVGGTIFEAANDDCNDGSENENCRFCQDLHKDAEYQNLLKKALRSGQLMYETLEYILEQNPQCKKIDWVFSDYDSCMASTQRIDQIDIMNANLKQKKQSSGEIFEPINSESDFCESMFPNPDEIDTKITCYDKVGKPLGPKKCLDYQRVTNNTIYEFNLFYKYFCLHTERVILDLASSSCLKQEWVEQKSFHHIEDCLKDYETSGYLPHLTLERSQFYYVRGSKEDDEINEAKKEDRETNFKIADIEKFICQDMTTLNFTSSPFQVTKNNSFYKINEFSIQLECSVFQFENATRDNLMVHYKFTNQTTPHKTNPDKNEQGLDLYTQDFNLSTLTVNRTDQNEQYFDMQYSEDLDLIQVLTHRLYHHQKHAQVRKFMKLESYSDFLNFTSDPYTLKVFETYPQIISQELMVNKRIMAESFKEVVLQANVTYRILGFLPYGYEDYEITKIQVKKISDMVKPIKKDQLLRAEKNRVNEFKVFLDLDFSEVSVTTSFYSALDIFSELGGLSASIGGIMAQLSVLFLISYNYQLSSLISRKYKHTLKLQEIKQYSKLIPEISQIVKAKLGQVGIDQKNLELLNEDLKTIEIVKAQDYEHKYDLTEKRHDILAELIERHLPECLDPSARFELQREENMEDEFELIEIDENEAKHQMHVSKASLPLADILSALRERISFYGVYKQADNIQKNKIMIKKLKYQIKLEKDKREKIEGEVKEEREKREKIEGQLKEEREKIETEVQKLKSQVKMEKEKRCKAEAKMIGHVQELNKVAIDHVQELYKRIENLEKAKVE